MKAKDCEMHAEHLQFAIHTATNPDLHAQHLEKSMYPFIQPCLQKNPFSERLCNMSVML
jgi:hypothetical protein